MRRFIIGMLAMVLLAMPANAMEFTAPPAPESAEAYMPSEPESFWEGVWYILRNAIADTQPKIAEGASVCLSLVAVVLLLSLFRGLNSGIKGVLQICGTVAISTMLLQSVNSMIQMGANTVAELADYGKMFVPVMTSALAAQGGVTASAALYAGTIVFNTLLSGMIAKLLLPVLYIYLCLCIACNAIDEVILQKMRDLAKWLISWGLKIVLYIFTGYMTITGVVSGTADASALKATKLAISGVVPVIGSVLSDASESILVSAGLLKNTVGIYGMLTILSIMVGPFVQVGIQHLLLKGTSAVCGIFGEKSTAGLIQDFSSAMGMVMGMIGTMCLLLMIGTVCFMKGIG